eukprot:11406659-Karenia_brevis.AAC.1
MFNFVDTSCSCHANMCSCYNSESGRRLFAIATSRQYCTYSGYDSAEWFALVHQPINLKQAQLIPDAVKVLDDECTKLENRHTWSLDTVREQHRAKDEATANIEETHF